MTTTGTASARLTVPLIKADLPDYAAIEGDLRGILQSGRITNFGQYVQAFEKHAGEYLDAEAATTSSGTMALLFTLQALGLERGQKVILPSFTFMATAQAVVYAGGVPVFAECEEDVTISPKDLAGLLDRHDDVAGVIGVHTYGLPCRVDDIQEVVAAEEKKRGRKIFLIYDAAHAFGSSIRGRRVGSFGDAEVFSLSVTKALVSVEGGMVVSRNADLMQRVRKMRNYGIEDSYNAHFPGLNGKMSEFHGLIGLRNLERLDSILAERQGKARYYSERIGERTRFGLMATPEDVVHTYKDFTVLTPAGMECRRDETIASLKARGIETRAYFYPAVHEQKFFRKFADRTLPVTEKMSRQVITLPFYTSITQIEMDYVVEGLVEAETKPA